MGIGAGGRGGGGVPERPAAAAAGGRRRAGPARLPAAVPRGFRSPAARGPRPPPGAVERAGLKGLNDNQKIGYELQSGRDGKQSAGDLRLP